MEISELKAELEKLHPASFGWALSCCRQNQADAEEVLQMVYLKILQGKARYRRVFLRKRQRERKLITDAELLSRWQSPTFGLMELPIGVT